MNKSPYPKFEGPLCDCAVCKKMIPKKCLRCGLAIYKTCDRHSTCESCVISNRAGRLDVDSTGGIGTVMKSAICAVLLASVFLFAPQTFVEDFETPKAWMLTAFGCIVVFHLNWRDVTRSAIGFLLIMLLWSAALSSWFSIDPHRSKYGDPQIPNGLLLTASYVVFYAAVKQNFRDIGSRRLLMSCVIAAATLVACHALFETAGIDFLSWSGFPSDGHFIRPPSTLGHPNYMAAFLSMALPFALWFGDTTKGRWGAAPFYASVCLMSAAIVASQSRGAMIATLAAVVVYFLHGGRFWRRFSMFCVMSTIVFGVLFAGVPAFRENAAKRMQNIMNPGGTRWFYSTAALKMWKQHPWIGVGTDAYSTAFAPLRNEWYWQQQPGGAPTRAHNESVNILATQGLIGFSIVTFLALTIWIFCLLSDSMALQPASAAIASFFVFNLSGFVVVSTGVLFMMCLAMLSKET